MNKKVVHMKASVDFYGMTPADLVLQAKIAGLEPDAVEILDLHYKQGYSDAEIASMRGQPRGTIASTLHRIRETVGKLVNSEQWSGQLARISHKV